MYHKDFNLWNVTKQKIDTHEIDNLYFKEREIWWTSVGVNVGSEIDGKNELFERPVIVIKKLNRTKFFGIPLTTQAKSDSFFVPVRYGEFGGVAAIVDFRSFSSKRLLRKLGKVNLEDFDSVVTKFNQLIKR